MEYFVQFTPQGRVFIDSAVHKDCLPERSITANTWQEARNKVNAGEFVPRPGYGYFLDPSNGCATLTDK